MRPPAVHRRTRPRFLHESQEHLPPAGASRLRDEGPNWPASSMGGRGCVFPSAAQPSQDLSGATRGRGHMLVRCASISMLRWMVHNVVAAGTWFEALGRWSNLMQGLGSAIVSGL